MSPDEIKRIREYQGITQEELASILGVTKTTVGRYEIGKAKPVGDAEKKLGQLQTSIEDPEQASLLKETIKKVGGIAIIAGMLSFASAMIPLSGVVACSLGIGALLKGKIGKDFIDILTKFHK